MIITGFENLKRAYSIDSDSSNSSDLSKIESHYSEETGNDEKLKRKRDTIVLFDMFIVIEKDKNCPSRKYFDEYDSNKPEAKECQETQDSNDAGT